MPNYQNGKVYRIVCNITGEQYIGSTCQNLSSRLAQHIYEFNNDKGTSSKPIIARGNYSIILIESFPCNNKDELMMRERYYQETMDCVNIIKRAIRTQEERDNYRLEPTRSEYLKAHGEKYRAEHKDYFDAKNKEYNGVKYTCDCGDTLNWNKKARHEKTARNRTDCVRGLRRVGSRR